MSTSGDPRELWSPGARAAWAQGDWPATIDDLVQQAADRDDAEPLAIAAELSGIDPAAGLLTAHAETIAGMSQSVVRDAVLSYLAVLSEHADRGAATAVALFRALTPSHPAAAASLSIGAGLVLVDRARWVEAGRFADAASDAVDAVGASRPGVEPDALEAWWFTLMAVSVLVEWNTHSGETAFDSLSAALARPRARNLLRPHHAPALVAVAHVSIGRGDFGAAAVGLARAARLLADSPLPQASALAALTLVRYRQGQWSEARYSAQQVVALTEDVDSPWARVLGDAVRMLAPAMTGDFAGARELLDRVLSESGPQRGGGAEHILFHARLALALGETDWPGLIRLVQGAEGAGHRPLYTVHEWRMLDAMALRNVGRHDEYREAMALWRADPDAVTHPYFWTHEALLAQMEDRPSDALAAARQARSLLGDGDDPLGRGWSRMVVGGILSVYGHPTEGMESWEAARAELAEVGGTGFAALATRTIEEMAAEMARQGGDRLQVLTAQQRRIAELVAEGYTSAEIGQILYLSKKTIDFHVSNIVSRLGVAHRREVRRLIEAARTP